MGMRKPAGNRGSMMSIRQRQGSGLRTLMGPPVAVAIAASLLQLLPTEVIDIFTVWLLASLPIGVLLGHCILVDQE